MRRTEQPEPRGSFFSLCQPGHFPPMSAVVDSKKPADYGELGPNPLVPSSMVDIDMGPKEDLMPENKVQYDAFI